VIRQYSPSRTIGGGSVIEPVAAKRRRHGALDALEVRESGSLEARLLQMVEAEATPVSTSRLAQVVGESQTVVHAALARLLEEHEIAMPLEERWLALARWHAALEVIEREVRGYAGKFPARYGIMKGELKSGLKIAMEPALFDIAFHELEEDGRIETRSQRVRPADTPWEPPAATMAALQKLEAELEATGMSVPEALQWQAKLGPAAADVTALGLFLERLVRVNQELIYTAHQMKVLRAKLADHFAKKPALTMAEFKEMAGVSRKFAVPLLEHSDRVGWTVRSGDERKKGARLTAALS